MDKKKAVYLVNLGSPDSPKVEDVKNYLREFLMDGNVIDVPYLLRKFLLEVFILPSRPAKSAEAYQSIWWKEGSPLIVISQNVVTALKKEVGIPVGLGMRYGNPSSADGLKELMQHHPEVEEVLLIPLYPHFAMSSYQTAVEKVETESKRLFPNLKIAVKEPFYKQEDYVEALAAKIKPFIEEDFDKLLFSYHGIPERHLRKSDPTGSHCLKVENCCEVNSKAHDFCYRHQVFETTKAVANKLGLDQSKYELSFQSRLGRDPWLQPFTDKVIEEMPKRGVVKLLVVCPSFVSDCLETLEEIGMQARESFMENGGEKFDIIPCLNDSPDWIKVLKKWVNEFSHEESHQPQSAEVE